MAEEDPSREGAETAVDNPEAPIEGAEAPVGANGAPSPGRPSVMVVVRSLAGRCLANWRPILLTALVVAAAGLAAGLFFFQYRPDRQIDDAAADQAVRAASDGVVAMLSYSSDSLDRDFDNARSHLTGDFLAYYNKFGAEVVAPAVRQKHLTQKAVVIRAAVSQLHPESAVVLAYVNETVTSKDKKDPMMTPSIVRVTLAKVDGSWLISKVDPVG
jgi:Mce-associated membrane protein